MADGSQAETQVTDDRQLLVHALTSMTGAFSEVATSWRRVHRSRPDLPLDVPLRLERSARRLAALAERLRWAAPGEWPAWMLEIGNQLTALEEGIAAASAMTCGPGAPPAGDARLWRYLGTAMHQARLHALNLTLTPPGRPDTSEPATGAPTPVSLGRI